jgi:hypothetical protein
MWLKVKALSSNSSTTKNKKNISNTHLVPTTSSGVWEVLLPGPWRPEENSNLYHHPGQKASPDTQPAMQRRPSRRTVRTTAAPRDTKPTQKTLASAVSLVHGSQVPQSLTENRAVFNPPVLPTSGDQGLAV